MTMLWTDPIDPIEPIRPARREPSIRPDVVVTVCVAIIIVALVVGVAATLGVLGGWL